MKIAVLMTCYNRVETTLACLKELFAQKIPEGYSFEVWLVDDASPDKTGERVKAAFPQVKVIHGAGNLFWCKGMRLAWETCLEHEVNYDGFLWLNDDVELFDGALEGVFKDAEKTNYEGIIVGAFASDAALTKIVYGVTESTGCLRPSGEPIRTTGQMSGNLVFVPRFVFDRIGMIYGGYGHGFGDYDYGWMADRTKVSRYLSSKVCGICPQQPERYNQKLKGLSVVGRAKLLFDRKGFPIKDSVIYKYRKSGLPAAILSAGHIILERVILGKE